MRVATALLLPALVLLHRVDAADAERALKPLVAPGDTWTYRTTRPRAVELETITVTTVSESTDSIQADVDQRPDGTAPNPEPDRTGVWTREWNSKVLSRPGIGVGTVLRPHGAVFRFPMKVGDEYETAYELTTSTKSGPGPTYRIRRTTKVVRWEEVVLPAGRFKTIVIESEGMAQEVGGGAWPMSVTLWYAPEVRRQVKYQQRGWPNDSESELLSYKLIELK